MLWFNISEIKTVFGFAAGENSVFSLPFLFRNGYQEDCGWVPGKETEWIPVGEAEEREERKRERELGYNEFFTDWMNEWLTWPYYLLCRPWSISRSTSIYSLGKETPSIQYGIARNHGRRRNKNSERKWGLRLEIADEDIWSAWEGEIEVQRWTNASPWVGRISCVQERLTILRML